MSFFRIGISYHFFLTYQVWRLSKKKERKTLQILTNFYKLIPILGLENKLYKLTHNISNKFFAFIYAKWIFKNFSQNKKKNPSLNLFLNNLTFFSLKEFNKFCHEKTKNFSSFKISFWLNYSSCYFPSGLFVWRRSKSTKSNCKFFFSEKSFQKVYFKRRKSS